MTLRLAVILGLVILVGGAVPAAAADTHVITVTVDGFSPSTLPIKQGDTVKWVWESGSQTITDGDPEQMEEAGKVLDLVIDSENPETTKLFEKIGTVSYFSRTNPSLRGTITVTGATPVTRRTWGWLKSIYEGA